MTLLEVLAALLILATLLAGILVAKSRALRQQTLAHRQLGAIAAADGLMEQWRTSDVPRPPAAGDVPLHPELRWQTRLAAQRPERRPLYDIVTLEIISRADRQVLLQLQWFMPTVAKSDEEPGTRSSATRGRSPL